MTFYDSYYVVDNVLLYPYRNSRNPLVNPAYLHLVHCIDLNFPSNTIEGNMKDEFTFNYKFDVYRSCK